MKLAICTPTTGLARIEWAESVINLIKKIMISPRYKIKDVKLFFFCSSNIPANRNKIINQALNWGATHLMFIDEDQRFPPECFLALLKNKELPIIGANCCKRMYPIEFMAIDHMGQQVDSRKKEGLEVVRATGFSFILIKEEVFRTVPKPWTAFPYRPDDDDYGTEDYFFFDKALEHGYECVIDHDVSKIVQHIGPHVFDPLSERGVYVKEQLPDDSTD